MCCSRMKYVTVTDNWHPNFHDNLIKITLGMYFYDGDCYVKLMAWGADDFGLEICIDDLTFRDAIDLYNNELNTLYESIPKVTNKDWFFDHGFERF